MKTKKSRIIEHLDEKREKRLSRVQQDSEEATAKMEPWARREEETRLLLLAAKRKLPELKALLAATSDHWHYEDPIYRFYHQSFKIYRLQATTLEIVENLQALAPHLKLNSMFLEIVAEGTGKEARPIVEAFFHAHHMLLMVCKYAELLPESPPTLPSGWATVLYLYNIR
jgi:hypothetical protein